MKEKKPVVGLAERLGLAVVWALVWVPPLVVLPTAQDPFRLPKLFAVELLALLSLVLLCLPLLSRRSLSVRRLMAVPTFLPALLLLISATVSGLGAYHPAHWRSALFSFGLGLTCLVWWGVQIPRSSLRRLLSATVGPALVLSTLAVAQWHGLYQPFGFLEGEGRGRYGLTSLAGNVGDLASFLVLPLVICQAQLWRRRGARHRAPWLSAVLILSYALILTQTMSALIAVAVGSLVFWWLALERQRWRIVLLLLIGVILVLGVRPLRQRVQRKLSELERGQISVVLSGRTEAWMASLAMVGESPGLGVGHGGFRPHFGAAKLRLIESGKTFRSVGDTASFANAHNEYLELLAEWGLVGAVGFVVAMVLLCLRLRERAAKSERLDKALAFGGLSAVAVLSLAAFPLRLGPSGYLVVLFVAWIFSTEQGREPAEGSARIRSWQLGVPLIALLLIALGAHFGSAGDRLEAARILRTTSLVAQRSAQQGGQVPAILRANLRPLRRARELDTLEVGVPMALGSHYLLLGNAAAAIEWYEKAIDLEPRPNLYFNLARALLMAERSSEAFEHLDSAVRLDPALREPSRALGWTPERI